MKSIFYRYPLLYDWGIRFLYLDGLRIVKDLIGKNKSVFEPACGFGRMKRYLYPGCEYSGIDLNKDFIEYGQKKNRDILLGNVLEETRYRKADTILLCDILHHLKKHQIRELLHIAVKYAKEKIVIIEPTFVDIAARNNVFSRGVGKIMTVVDDDGFNRIEHWMSKVEYHELFESLKEENHIEEMKIRNHRNHDFVTMFINGYAKSQHA